MICARRGFFRRAAHAGAPALASKPVANALAMPLRAIRAARATPGAQRDLLQSWRTRCSKPPNCLHAPPPKVRSAAVRCSDDMSGAAAHAPERPQPRAGMLIALALCGWGCLTLAQANPELAQQHHCLDCHAVDKEVVGPAYQAEARRYKDRSDAEATLVANIKADGSGKWGPAPMPPLGALSDAAARVLARWILSLIG